MPKEMTLLEAAEFWRERAKLSNRSTPVVFGFFSGQYFCDVCTARAPKEHELKHTDACPYAAAERAIERARKEAHG